MRYQTYVLHLIDGNRHPDGGGLRPAPQKKELWATSPKRLTDEIFTVGDRLLGFALYPQEQHCLPGNRRSDCEVIFWRSRSTGKSVTTPNPCFSG